MTKEDKINEIIELVKNDTILLHKYTDVMGEPPPDSLMETLFNELWNRSSMLFTAWLPRLASVREYTGRFSYKDAFSYICERARQELGTGTLASREKFIAALEEWEVSNSVKEV